MGAVYAWENVAEAPGAQIDVSSEALGLGVRALLTEPISDIWRSGVWSGTITLSVDLGITRDDLRIFAIAAPRDSVLPASDAQVRLIASIVSAGASDALDTGLGSLEMRPRGLLVRLLSVPITARYLQWQFVAGTGDTYLQLGRLWAGPALVTDRSVSYGQARGFADAGNTDRAGLSGVRYSRRGSIRRQSSFTQPLMKTAEIDALDRCINLVGTTRQLLVSPFETSISSDGVFGTFASLPRLVRASPMNWSVDISMEEDC